MKSSQRSTTTVQNGSYPGFVCEVSSSRKTNSFLSSKTQTRHPFKERLRWEIWGTRLCFPSQHPIREGIPTQHRASKRGFDSGVSTSSVTKKRVCPSITHKASNAFLRILERQGHQQITASSASPIIVPPIFHKKWIMFRAQEYKCNQVERNRN